MMRIVECRSPNHDARPEGTRIDMLLLHYTGMRTAGEALDRLCDPEARVSAHYTIGTDGVVHRHVPEERRAWHAGASFWAGRRAVNDCSIGIELVNPGSEFGYVPFTEEQIAALIELARGVVERHAIPAARVLGHSDVAPARKDDPGELFPWQRLAANGIGVWPSVAPPLSSPVHGGGAAGPSEAAEGAAAMLARFGYGVPPAADWPLEVTIAAFQRHFRPSCIDGVADAECVAILAALTRS